MRSIRFLSCDLRDALRVFKKAKTSPRNILGKSMLVKVYDEYVCLCTTDGASYLETAVQAEIIGDWEDDASIVIHSNSLALSLEGSDDTVTLQEEDSGLYTYFERGRLFVPTYGLAEEIFVKQGLQKPCRKWELETPRMTYVFDSLDPIISTPGQPQGLAFYFFTPLGAYCSNGSLICRVVGEFPDLVIRQRDLPMIYQVIGSTSDTMHLYKFHDCYQVSCDRLKYTFPELVQSLSSDWKSCPEATVGSCLVNVGDVRRLVSIFDRMPDSSGISSLFFSGASLSIIGQTRKGDESSVTLSTEMDGMPRQGTYPVATKTLLVALDVFEPDGVCHMGISDRGLLQMFVKDKYLTILLKAM